MVDRGMRVINQRRS